MILIDFLFALFFALVIGGLFAAAFRTRGPWDSLLLFLLVILLFTWAGGAWITPFGPVLWGGYWLPFLVIALIITVLLAAAAPVNAKEERLERSVEPTERVEESIVVGAVSFFFWIFIFFLILALLFAYLF